MVGMARRVASGTKWMFGARVARLFVGMGTVTFLARHLTPEEFGGMALVLFVTLLAQTVSDFGTRIALVQRSVITELEQQSVFWFNICMATILASLCLAFAPDIAQLLGAPDVAGPLAWMAPIFLLGMLPVVSKSLLERQFEFGRLALAETLGMLAGAVTAILFVWQGAGIEALVAQQMVLSGVQTTTIMVATRWRPALTFSWTALLPILRFGGLFAASGLIHFAARDSSRPIVANGLSTTALGYLSIAQQFVEIPLTVLRTTAQGTLFPAFSSLKEDKARLRGAHLRALHGLTLVLMPVAVGVASVSENFVQVVLGDAWAPATAIIPVLAFGAPITTLGAINMTAIGALGRGGTFFTINAAGAVLRVGALLWAVQFGLVAVALAGLVTEMAIAIISAHRAFPLFGQTAGAVVKALARPVVASLTMGAVVYGLQKYLTAPAPVELAAAILTGIVSYTALILTLDWTRALEVLRLFRRVAPDL